MIKIFHQYAPPELPLLVLAESAVIMLSLGTVMAWRVPHFWRSPPALAAWAATSVLLMLVCQFCLHLRDLYDLRYHGRQSVLRLLEAFGLATLLIACLCASIPAMHRDGGTLAAALPAILALVLLGRLVLELRLRSGARGERLLLVDSGTCLESLLQQVQKRPELRLQFLGLVADAAALPPARASASPPWLGETADLARLACELRPDRVVVGPPRPRHGLPMQELVAIESMGIAVETSSTLYERISGRLPLDALRPLEWRRSPSHRPEAPRLAERSVDVAGAVILLLLASPLMLLVALAVWLDSRGPILYRQERAGLGGRCFEMLKFRSMRPDAERGHGPVWARANDPRMTRVGRLIRKRHLDELPQLWNLLRGEMTLVGPRPERFAFAERLDAAIPHYQLRQAVRPGITGWAQVCYPYGCSTADARAKLEFDLFYVKHLSLGLGLLVLLQTLKIMVLGRGAR